jgi:hypothetical protein
MAEDKRASSKGSFVVDKLSADDPEVLKLAELQLLRDEVSKQRKIAREKNFQVKYPNISSLAEKIQKTEPKPKEAEVPVEVPVEVPKAETPKAPKIIEPPTYHPTSPADLKPGVINVIRADKNGRWF